MTRVVIDATAIPASRGGVGRYVDGILKQAASDSNSGIELVVVCQQHDQDLYRGWGLDVVAGPARLKSTAYRLVWEQLFLPRLAKQLGADAIHSPHYTFPLLWRGRRIVTIHDLTFFSDPKVHSPLKAAFFKWWIRRVAAVKCQVISVSESTALEFARWVGGERSKVTVSGLATDPEIFRVPTSLEIRRLKDRLGTESWIAFLATLEPRKNAAALIDAYLQVWQRTPHDGFPALLLAGGAGWDTAVGPAVEYARSLGADVRTLGYLPIEELSPFLGGADVFVYPSFGEGFGLPVLEAMACGAAVITTRELSLPEVGGAAVSYCDPEAHSIAESLERLLLDARYRDELSGHAQERARSFTWSSVWSRHIEVYQGDQRRTDSI